MKEYTENKYGWRSQKLQTADNNQAIMPGNNQTVMPDQQSDYHAGPSLKDFNSSSVDPASPRYL